MCMCVCTGYIVHSVSDCESVWVFKGVCVCVCVCVCIAAMNHWADFLLPFPSCNGLDTYTKSFFILLFISIDSRRRPCIKD